MITLLEKKDKDRPLIKNWRPISLINVDVKIASKAIARRLERIILKVLSKAALIAVTEYLIKEINSLIYIELISVSST